MKLEDHIEHLETILSELSNYERKGLDTSSLRQFIKNLKVFNRINRVQEKKVNIEANIPFEEKLNLIKSFLKDKKAFPKIQDIIHFANKELDLQFKDQKESRETTINRILTRIEKSPELKESVKKAAFNIRNRKIHYHNKRGTKKEKESAESFAKWAELLNNL